MLQKLEKSTSLMGSYADLHFFNHSSIILRSVSPRFIDFCVDMPYWFPLWHKNGCQKLTEASVIEFNLLWK